MTASFFPGRKWQPLEGRKQARIETPSLLLLSCQGEDRYAATYKKEEEEEEEEALRFPFPPLPSALHLATVVVDACGVRSPRSGF